MLVWLSDVGICGWRQSLFFHWRRNVMQDSCDWRYLAPTPISLSLFFFFLMCGGFGVCWVLNS